MGCVSSSLLSRDDDFSQLGSTALSQHIVSLTSTTYGFLTLDPPQPNPTTPPPRFTLGSIFPSPLSEPKSLWSEPRPLRPEPEVINSWELMAGLDADSFRFPTTTTNKENSNPNHTPRFKPLTDAVSRPTLSAALDKFEKICPPKGEHGVVLYTTSLRGVRKTFEACNAVRAAIESAGVLISERDISMDRGFREELRELMRGKEREAMVPPRVFVNGRYIGGAEEVMGIVEEGCLGELFVGLPKRRAGDVCEGCGGVRFVMCEECSGSCKIVVVVVKEAAEFGEKKERSSVVVRCPDCNENGLVLCPICS